MRANLPNGSVGGLDTPTSSARGVGGLGDKSSKIKIVSENKQTFHKPVRSNLSASVVGELGVPSVPTRGVGNLGTLKLVSRCENGAEKRGQGQGQSSPLLPVSSTGQNKSISGKDNFVFFFGYQSPFSQHHPVNINVDGTIYNCAEQYYMYQKARLFKDDRIAKKIMRETSPIEQKKLGKKVEGFDQDKWLRVAVGLVEKCNMAKFSQNQSLKQILLDTYPKILVEASPRDCTWGIGMAATDKRATDMKLWKGDNLLGFALTRVRERLLGVEESVKRCVPASVVGKVSQSTGSQITSQNLSLPSSVDGRILIDDLPAQGVKRQTLPTKGVDKGLSRSVQLEIVKQNLPAGSSGKIVIDDLPIDTSVPEKGLSLQLKGVGKKSPR
jgi:ribA/ribD-fused uncharacterized protein